MPTFDEPQDVVVEAERRVEDAAQPAALRVLAPRALVELDAGFRGEDPERLGERDTVALHHEAVDVAAEAAPEALPRFPGGRHHE